MQADRVFCQKGSHAQLFNAGTALSVACMHDRKLKWKLLGRIYEAAFRVPEPGVPERFGVPSTVLNPRLVSPSNAALARLC